MDYAEKIVEYYDELFPVTKDEKSFFEDLVKSSAIESRILSIGCGTGVLEHHLAKKGCNVTGIDDNYCLLNSATRKSKPVYANIRFFSMSPLDMSHFLTHGFFTHIFCVSNRLIYISEIKIMKKIFADCKSLLHPGGCFVFQLPNYSYYISKGETLLPVSKSIRAKLLSKLIFAKGKSPVFLQQVETSTGNLVTIVDHKPIVLLLKDTITEWAKELGYTKVDYFSSFNKEPFDEKTSLTMVCVMQL